MCTCSPFGPSGPGNPSGPRIPWNNKQQQWDDEKHIVQFLVYQNILTTCFRTTSSWADGLLWDFIISIIKPLMWPYNLSLTHCVGLFQSEMSHKSELIFTQPQICCQKSEHTTHVSESVVNSTSVTNVWLKECWQRMSLMSSFCDNRGHHYASCQCKQVSRLFQLNSQKLITEGGL